MLVGASLGGIAALLAEGEAAARSRAPSCWSTSRRASSAPAAMRIVAFMTGAPEGFASLEEAADAVAAYLPHRAAADRSGRARARTCARATTAAGAGTGTRDCWARPAIAADRANGQIPARLRAASAALEVPTLLVRGGVSDVVSVEVAHEFGGLAPHADIVDVSGAGHMVAGDDNDSFTAAVIGFLARVR